MLLNQFLERSSNLFPHKVALICQGKEYTFSEIDNAANSLGNSLVEGGFQRQDRAIIYLDNSYESVISIFGILKAGGIFVVINPTVKHKKLESILVDCDARIVITDSNHIMELFTAISNLKELPFIIVTDFEKITLLREVVSNIGLLSFHDMIENTNQDPLHQHCIDVDLASLIYTSGSSGNPKGVMLTHHNMVSAANSITQYLENTQDDIIINSLPLSFDYGLYQVLMAFKIGGTVVLEKGFVFPEQIIHTVVREKVTGWPIVPTIAAILCRSKSLEKHDFSHLRYITSTGQALPINHIARLKEAFPAVKIYSMYGLTECKRVSYLPPKDIGRKPGSVGIPMPNTEVYIIDENGKEIIESDKTGELVVRGSNVMKGYWHLPELTKMALRPGRYGEKVLFTGDLFRKDEEGYLYFVGRKDDMIKTSGFLVSPKEVENILYEIKDVVEAAVIGVKDEILGQAIKAYIHLSENSKVNESDILTFCSHNLENYAVPKYINFCGTLPKTESGKIQKQDLF